MKYNIWKFNKALFLVMAGVMLLCLFLPAENARASDVHSRVIHVVYDDSGSMFNIDNIAVDTWCQAKYSMEVFAAMLGEADKMNVYYMSDYENGTASDPRIQLDGQSGAETNVAKIHNQRTVAGNTPFDSVRKAYADLQDASADEKWLVILTDGEFQGVEGTEGIDAFLSQKDADINVMFLGMGENADGITEKQEESIYYVEAATSSDILNKITEICTRIFNSNKLEVDVSQKSFSFDIPMGELTVFAQGANVSINGIEKDGTVIPSSRTPVEVKYSECDAENYDNEPVTNLLGKIAIFKDDFPAGSYTIDVSGAETIEIYYKPNIEVAAYLTDSAGNTVENLSNLPAGDYTISFGFVKAGTSEKVAQSSLLGDVSYEAAVTNNGVTHDSLYSDGDIITLEEGPLQIDVTANYLEYNTVATSLSYDIYQDKEITFSLKNDPVYTVTSEGLTGNGNIEVTALIDGQEMTAEQWEAMEAPKVRLADEERDFKLEAPVMEKTEETGVFRILLSLPEGRPSTGTYKNCGYQVVYDQQFGSEHWQGSMEGTLQLEDTRSWWERNWDLVVKLAAWLVVLLILAGYLPFIKNYLPKTLKKRPYIKCIPSMLGEKRKDRNGTVEKNLLSTIVPYVSQKGRIMYVPKGVTGCPALAVRAVRRRRMLVTNIKAFAEKDYITFDGETIKKDVKKYEISSGVSIRAKRGEWTYICTPSQTNK